MRWSPTYVAGIVFGCALGTLPCLAQEKPKATLAPVDASAKQEDPPYRGLDAALYMQTSAEYRACCLQAFRLASMIVDSKVKAHAAGTPNDKPLAVVLDLDETVLDNGFYQANQIRSRAAFDAATWSRWENEGQAEVRLVPGAKDFILSLKEQNIAPVYITNRNDRARQETMKALQRFGIEVPESQLLCADEQTGTNKTSRREKVQSQFEVILYVGDNLRDFDERFRFDKQAGIEGRSKVVDTLADKFGTEWVILPNPAYGEWTKAGQGTMADENLLYK